MASIEKMLKMLYTFFFERLPQSFGSRGKDSMEVFDSAHPSGPEEYGILVG